MFVDWIKIHALKIQYFTVSSRVNSRGFGRCKLGSCKDMNRRIPRCYVMYTSPSIYYNADAYYS